MNASGPTTIERDQRADRSAARPLRVCLFTDTLGDLNGVARFVQNAADCAVRLGFDLHVVTSTRFMPAARPNVHNVPPVLRRPMPGYAALDVVWPDRGAMFLLVDRIRPDVVHVSTPGPVGLAGRRWALTRRVPLVGTYHTDFPAYINHLFDDSALTWLCERSMRWFYAPFERVLTRSEAYAPALRRLGIGTDRIARLAPGIDTDLFSPARRDEGGAIWASLPGIRTQSVKVLYVGRVSVEKNLPLLTRAWVEARAILSNRGIDAQLIIVGDGPYRVEMERALRGRDALFAGFRHGHQLAAMYASSDVFVFPSTTDTLGQAVMEAQVSGLPAVVSDQGGPQSIVENGVTGHVLPSSGGEREIGLWARTIADLAENREVRQRMGDAGAARLATMPISRSIKYFWSIHEQIAQRTTPMRIHAHGRC